MRSSPSPSKVSSKRAYVYWYTIAFSTHFCTVINMKTKLFLFASLFSMMGAGINPILGQSRFSVSFNIAPIYGHSAYKAILPLSIDPAYPTTEVISRSHSLGYSFGLLGHYNFSPKWSLSAGVWATSFLSTDGEFSTNGTSVLISLPNHHPFRYGYRIPVLLNYQPSSKRISPYFSLGTSANFRQTSYVYINGQEIPIKTGKAIVNGPLIVGAGAIFNLKEHTSLVIQPLLEYNLKAKPSDYIYSHSYSLSLQVQLRHHF